MILKRPGPAWIARSSQRSAQRRRPGEKEEELAAGGHIVCSNASAFRYDADVLLLIPGSQPRTPGLIEVQQKRRGRSGFITTNPNCSTTHLVSALHPLYTAFGIRKLFVVTMQAVSGAGYPGVSSMDILDNIVPYIGKEEEKMEKREPQKLLGHFNGQSIEMADFVVSAHCNRVPVRNGHLEAVSIEFDRAPGMDEIVDAWRSYKPLAQQLNLPSAPQPALIYREEADRPQPRLDRLAGSVPGMTTVIGRLREDPIFHAKFLLAARPQYHPRRRRWQPAKRRTAGGAGLPGVEAAALAGAWRSRLQLLTTDDGP
ncbi:MAG: aspartate-semialdehyde dehydrogenase [Caldilineaceae bacterium]